MQEMTDEVRAKGKDCWPNNNEFGDCDKEERELTEYEETARTVLFREDEGAKKHEMIKIILQQDERKKSLHETVGNATLEREETCTLENEDKVLLTMRGISNNVLKQRKTSYRRTRGKNSGPLQQRKMFLMRGWTPEA